jgi:hypothetical protein
MNATVIKILYNHKKLTSKQVWQYADDGIITAQEAVKICGARPMEETNA